MRRTRCFAVSIILVLFIGQACPASAQSADDNAPFFTAAGVVQAATQTAGALAPNTLATIYGTNLSWTTHSLTAADLNEGTLPTSLDGVTVYVDNIPSNLIYVSPGQINFLIPYEIVASSVSVVVVRQGVSGPYDANGNPSAVVPLALTAPGFFEWNGNFAVAEHADGTLITPTSAAQAGEVVVLYATGLGRTSPDTASGVVPQTAMPILYFPELQVLINGVALPRQNIFYAGVTPDFAGLYQINLLLPDSVPADPEIQIVIGSQSSPPGVQLYTN